MRPRELVHRAAADLSDVIDLYVTLTVPHIDLLGFDEILPVIFKDISDRQDMSMVKQSFSGSSVLNLLHGEGKKLLKRFDEQAGLSAGLAYDIDTLERETLIEISNIIMGACISKIAQFLGDAVSYSPPRYHAYDPIDKTLVEASIASSPSATTPISPRNCIASCSA